MPGDFPYDVFLSHNAKDKAVVRPLAERLRQDGLKEWPVPPKRLRGGGFDEWVLKPGDSIPAKIEAGLEHSRVLVLCMSAHAFGSDWAQLLTLPQPSILNYQPACDPLNQERRFIPLRLDECGVNDIRHTSHADQLVKTCRAVFNQGDDFVQKITGNPNVDRPLQRIREFRNRPNPKVVVTVDMLSTGVDIPPLEFLVFLRPVKSRILWEQTLGRGTRLCPDINKSKFVVFDCFDGTLIQYFRNVSSFDIEPPGGTPLTLPEVIENIWQNVDRDYHVRILAKRLLRIDKDMNADARIQFAAWIPEGDVGRFAKELPQQLKQDFIGKQLAA